MQKQRRKQRNKQMKFPFLEIGASAPDLSLKDIYGNTIFDEAFRVNRWKRHSKNIIIT